jgi:hypothetical protein
MHHRRADAHAHYGASRAQAYDRARRLSGRRGITGSLAGRVARGQARRVTVTGRLARRIAGAVAESGCRCRAGHTYHPQGHLPGHHRLPDQLVARA